jgi:hypothetical protein
MLIRRQNPYAPRGKQRTRRREAQSREPVNKLKELSVDFYTLELYVYTSVCVSQQF